MLSIREQARRALRRDQEQPAEGHGDRTRHQHQTSYVPCTFQRIAQALGEEHDRQNPGTLRMKSVNVHYTWSLTTAQWLFWRAQRRRKE